jgi:hypothetical protein
MLVGRASGEEQSIAAARTTEDSAAARASGEKVLLMDLIAVLEL